jgi:hypothetical protein
LKDLPWHPISLMNVTKDSMGCLGNILHPKPTKYGSYKY